jgi:hypothetical protein
VGVVPLTCGGEGDACPFWIAKRVAMWVYGSE